MGQLRRAAAVIVCAAALAGQCLTAAGQERRRVAADDPVAERRLSGVYRIDLGRSDRLYSVVAGASSKLPYAEQQKFFIDLTVRLTPPDQIAVERRGRRVQIASSRAPRITFEADGVARGERGADGQVTTTRAALEGDRLTVTVSGGTSDRFTVIFAPLDGGRFLSVTRRIGAPQLNEPVVIHTVYEKVSRAPRWDAYGMPQLATNEGPAADGSATEGAREAATADGQSRAADGLSRSRAAGAQSPRAARAEVRQASATAARVAATEGEWAAALRSALDEWIEATNRRDIVRQMEFYAPMLKAFYLTRNVPRSAVRAEKARVFGRASAVDIRADAPEIVLAEAGRTAVMRFRKIYRIEGRGGSRSGAVVQELRWERTPGGWKITSERDVRVLH